MSSNIKDIWKEQAETFENEVVRTRVRELKNLNCYIGTISFSKAKLLIIELNSDINVHANYLKRFTGVEVQVLSVSSDKKELIIMLLEEELTDIFVLFIEDIIKSLLLVKDSRDVLNIISNRINYWKKLFGKYSGGKLTPQQQRGLYGELYFIKKLFENNIPYNRIIEAWQAPTGSNQDFYFDRNAVEIKTSKSNNPTLKISNEYQLDIAGLDNLYIVLFKVNEYPDSNNTLLKIIVDIRAYLNNYSDLLNAFNQKLESLGITSEIEEEYNITSVDIINEKYYKVENNFPRIIQGMVDEAISNISYEVNLNECIQFEVPFENVLNDF